MIQNDHELAVTRERISYFLDLPARLRVSSRPQELPLVTSGYRAEVEGMQREVLDHLTQPAPAKAGWNLLAAFFRGVKIMHESSAFALYEEKGRQEGRQEGRLEESHRLVLRPGRNRFGAPDAASEAALRAISDLDRWPRLGWR
jgi:hypothetical protein